MNINKQRSLKKRKLTNEQVVSLYEKGESTTVIAEKANVTPRYIREILTKEKVDFRPRGSWRRKYEVNEDYFKTWSNNMAYILGFFAADGHVHETSQVISFSQKEKLILDRIRNELGSNHPIVKNKKTGVYTLNINSKIVKQDIIRLHGIYPQKSLTLKFPHIPDPFLHHFIRGYFDGDGYINYNKKQVCIVSGSLGFLSTMHEIIKMLNVKTIFSQKEKQSRLFINGRKSIKVFSEWIYNDKDLYIDRKFKEFNKEPLKVHQLKDREHSTTRNDVIKRKQQFIEDYKRTKSIELSCKNIGIQIKTFKKWIDTNSDFRGTINKLNN
ncbi:endonuclease [Halobacillus yeomjeoni]|uniref:LAGLIDADG family homing endonuclease n=1 Tax=Halobacillus yeomjeoni TaxID=311194 RepID=UPI001CD4761C|nr:LAGLIDADG family homing endonuclease [Halobacillus yeomjeoni]MCA0983133.1 endonuclease [Halobacillus yeomjeoni]